MNNPYSAPQSSVQDRQVPDEPPKRPVLVWIIFIYAIVSIVFGMFGILGLVLMHGKHVAALNDVQQAYIDSLGLVDYMLAGAVYVLYAIGAIALFRLRKSAVIALGLYLVVVVSGAVYRFTKPSYKAFLGPGAHVGFYVGWLIALVIVAYAVRLRRAGVLR